MLTKGFLDIVQEFEWTDAYNICRLSSPSDSDEETKVWFTTEIFSPIKESIHTTKLVELDGSLQKDRRSLSEIYIPYVDRRHKDYRDEFRKLYDFGFKTIPGLLPKREHSEHWFDALDFNIFKDEKLGLNELTGVISKDVGTLDNFCTAYSMNQVEATTFLIEFIEFIISNKSQELFDEFALILNQSNCFCKLKGLKLDEVLHKNLVDGYDENLKDIYNSLSKSDCRNSLLHKEFERIDDLIDSEEKLEFKQLAKDTDEELRNYEGNPRDADFVLILQNLFDWDTNCGLSDEIRNSLFPYFSDKKSQLYFDITPPEELGYAFEIQRSGKSRVLAKLAKSSLSEADLEIIADNLTLLSSFIERLNSKLKDNPDKELGDIGEEFLFQQLCDHYGHDRVKWEKKSEYDFRILKDDLTQTQYYIDAKTTAKGIANSDNVPFFMRTAQWIFLDNQDVLDRYIIARVFNARGIIDVKYLKVNKQKLGD